MMDKGKLMIFFDYELQKGADSSIKGYKDGIEDFNQTKDILRILKKSEIKACFAVLGYAAEKGNLPYHAPQQIKQMAEEGHEVGSHTYSHQRISRLSYSELVEELKKSKNIIEKISNQKCITFVSPWDKPQYFFRWAVDFKPGTLMPKMSKLSQKEICTALKQTGYKTYRICPFTSRLNRFKLSQPFKVEGITCIPSRLSNGFGNDAKQIVKKAVEKKGIAVVYAHPRGLAHAGPQNKRFFLDFVNFIEYLNRNKKIEIITPSDLLIKNEIEDEPQY